MPFDPNVFQRSTFQQARERGVFDPVVFQTSAFQQLAPTKVFQRGVFQPFVFQEIAPRPRTARAASLPAGAFQYTPEPFEDDDAIAAMAAALTWSPFT